MNASLEQTTQKYYDCRINAEDTDRHEEQGLRTEGATVREAFFGRYPVGGMAGGRPPIGLNVSVDFDSFGNAGLTYVEMKDITGLMGDLDINKPEEMAGKKVVAYFANNSTRLVALSIKKGDEK